ncbi:alpha/beta hydrolase-fold protein [Planctomycetota bacterium]|nr:alpha/beta hydrolase-fold protein [Planctomycetota bacterium]
MNQNPPALQALLEHGPPSSDAIDTFIKENGPFPIREGTNTTFVFWGAADSVRWQHWIFGLPTSQEFHRVEGTDLWHLTVDLRKESRIEYKLLLDYGDRRALIRDPLNPLRAIDPYGANSVCATFGYERPSWTWPSEETRPGRMDTFVIHSEAFGDERHIQVYRPARFRPSCRYPLLVVHDGTDYQRFSTIKIVLDNLIHALEIPPMIVCFTNPGDRLYEYAADPRHADHIVNEILPVLDDLYPLEERLLSRCLMGASFGAVASLSTAWRHPNAFGKLLLQSGSFAFTDIGTHERGRAFDPVVEFMNEFRKAPGKPAEKIYLSCGIYESLIYENRSMVPLLQDCGVDIRFEEARDGHNWENWRDRLRNGLSWLFPGPLWMVYE